MNGKWTKENFIEHHKNNPHIYDAFSKLATKATRIREHYSAKTIFHVLRWNTQIEERDGEFKLDDGWIAHYSRKFMDEYPEHDGFFETRVRFNSYHKEESNDSFSLTN